MNLTAAEREKIFNKVVRLVEKKHFNPAGNGVTWASLAQQKREDILASQTPEEFERRMNALIMELRTSHTGFGHRTKRRIPARHAINSTFQPCETNGRQRWMFQDVHPGGPAHQSGIQPGDVLLAINGKEILPPEQPEFNVGVVPELSVLKRNGSTSSVTVQIPLPKSKKVAIVLPQPVSYCLRENGIGYLKVTVFPGAVGIDVAHDLRRAIERLQDCRRLIVDLRGNTGGGIGGLRLISYLTPGKLEVGYSLTRARAKNGYDKRDLTRFDRIPDHKRSLIWLALRYAAVDKSIVVVTEGLGPQKFHGRIVLLVNQHTASAAEMVAAFAQENNLATIVGTKTAGRLLSGHPFNLGKGYALWLPVGQYLTWQGKSLEGTGIHPTITAELDYEELKRGRDTQLEKAMEAVRAM